MNNNQNPFDVLKTSTMFHMSLGSKELFHSNFLHWISIVNWNAFLKIMHGLADVEKFWWEDEYCPDKLNLEVRREFHNFDLSIYILDSVSNATNGITDDDSTDYTEGGKKIQTWIPVLILENKMKSLPYKAQLDKYVEKAYKDYKAKAAVNQPITFILLSLLDSSLNYAYQYNKTGKRPKFSISFSGKWEHKTYSYLIAKINSIKRRYFSGLNYNLIDDYCRFVKALCHLAGNEWKVEPTDKYIDKICEGGDDERKFRIHDVREKIHYEQLLKLLENKLTKAGIFFKRFDKDKFKKRESGSVFTKIDYSHGIGLFEVQYVVSKEWRLIIQVQGNRYCHMIVNDKRKSIVNKNSKVNEPICKNLLCNYGKFIKDPTPNNPDWPNEVGSPNEKYGRYGNSNIYQWSEIPETCTIGDVIEAMCCDLEKIKKTWP